MALKFLNKKGWHTGSLRNIENVWKAEQKHDAEQRKLEELRKQIQDERERSEFRLLQEQAGLVPKQERLDFLYESGLGVGKGNSEGFKALQGPPGAAESSGTAAVASGGAGPSKAAVPGALFEDKPQSANDAWRKLHSDPLLLIRQREQEALSRIKSNPVQMAMIRKSVENEKKKKEQERKEKREKKHHKKKHSHSKAKHDSRSQRAGMSDDESIKDIVRKKREISPSERHVENRKRDDYSSGFDRDTEHKLQEAKHSRKRGHTGSEETVRRKESSPSDHRVEYRKHDKHSSEAHNRAGDRSKEVQDVRRKDNREQERHHSDHFRQSGSRQSESRSSGARRDASDNLPSSTVHREPGYNNRQNAPKLTQEEREARLKEMQLNAELHEEQRWKRLKKASEQEAQEAVQDKPSVGRNFLDAAKKGIYGTEKGGSSTIEESVRRRTFYLQGGSAADEKNAFRR